MSEIISTPESNTVSEPTQVELGAAARKLLLEIRQAESIEDTVNRLRETPVREVVLETQEYLASNIPDAELQLIESTVVKNIMDDPDMSHCDVSAKVDKEAFPPMITYYATRQR